MSLVVLPLVLCANPTTTPTIAGGGAFSLFVKTDGSLWTVGDNTSGQLGDGGTSRQASPVQLTTNVAAASAGFAHTLFIKTDGTLWGTGDNFYGQLGDFDFSHLTPFQIATSVKSAVAGVAHSLFLKNDGTLWAMGDNTYGQLGDGSGDSQHVPVQIAAGVQAIAAGHYHSLFVKNDNTLWAMGENGFGQLGDGSKTERDTPVQIASGVQKAAAGFNFSVFLKTDGTLWATGHNAYAQLGDGTLVSRSTPVQVATGVQDISCGSYHTLILTNSGGLFGSGWNTNGQLAVTDPPTSNGYHSVAVSIASSVAAIAAGDLHSLYVTNDGSLFAVGLNSKGQLGDGGTSEQHTPVFVSAGVATAPPPNGVAQFNGSYAGSYNGTAQFSNGGSAPVNGAVAFSVTNGSITVTAPGSGTGTVDSAGAASFAGSGSGDGAEYEFTGTFSIAASGNVAFSLTASEASATASGSWTATFSGGTASGTWAATLNGLVGNVSTRLPVGTDENVLIEGFIVQGPAGSTKKIIVRAIGPSLAPFGVADALANPTLEIRDESTATVATNNNWKTTQVGGIITGDQFAEISASQLAPSHDLESAIVANLAPGNYTAVVRGAGNTTGTGIVDAYDLSATSPARLANIATRGLIQPGDKLMIAGFIIQKGPVRAVISAVGPSLIGFGIANALPDTTLQLRDVNGAIVRENDNWESDQKQELEDTGLQPTHDLEAALVETIQPGQYTAQVRGQGNASGIGVVQVYFLQ